MDWTSDSDENGDSDLDTQKAKSNDVCGANNGPSKEILISGNDDDSHDSGWDSDEANVLPAHVAVAGQPKKASEAGPSHTNWTSHFVAMGFSEKLVVEAIKQNGEGDPDGILETLLTYGAIEKSPDHEASPVRCSLASVKDELDDDFSDFEDFEFEEIAGDFAEKDKIVSTLVDMGFLAEEASSAIDRCGTNASILELADSIHAAQMQEDSDDRLWESRASSSDADADESSAYILCRRKKIHSELDRKNKRPRICDRKKDFMKKMRPIHDNNVASLAVPNPMVGFGLPFQQPSVSHRRLPEAAMGPPFFYYENVALAPKGVWETISRFLYDIEPEFVDSKFFCAAARKRGYIHNLPHTKPPPTSSYPPKNNPRGFPCNKEVVAFLGHSYSS